MYIFGRQQVSGVSYALDDIGQPDFAWSERRLHSDYTGDAMEVREGGGNTDADIPYDGEDYNVSELNTHLSGNNGFINQFYSQGSVVTGTTALTSTNDAAQIRLDPTLPAAGVGVDFLSSTAAQDLWLNHGTPIFNTNVFEIFILYHPTDASNGVTVLGYGTTSFQIAAQHLAIRKYDTAVRLYINNLLRGNLTTANQEDKSVLVHVWREGSTSGTNVWAKVGTNAAVSITGTSPGTGGDKQYIGLFGGSISGTYEDFPGYIQEVIIYNSNLSASDRTAVRDNITTYYPGF